MKISAFSAFSAEPGSRFLDPGSWIQAPGSRLLDPGSRVLVVAHLVVNLANSANSAGYRVTEMLPSEF